MKQKILTIFFASLATVSCLFATPVRVGMLNYELDSKQKTAKVVSCEITGDITIPEQINANNAKYTVTSIGERAFYNDHHLVSITLPYTLISIEKAAFMGCSSLTKVILPQNITTIKERAFAGCIHLREIYNLSLTPISINTNVFDKVTFSRSIFIVYPSVIELYKSAKGWQDFTNIYPLEVRR